MADTEEDNPIDCSLHKCIFEDDFRKLNQLIRTNNVAQKDKHGNTALHLSVMLGRKVCTHLLLAHGAPVKVKNVNGWSPLAEAISYGDRQTICSLLKKLKQQAKEQIEERRPNLVKALKQMGDFYMELKWDFQSWVPLVSRILPSDICKIHKSGSSIRLDTTLVDFSDMRWERGDISFIFRGDNNPRESLTVLDNEYHCYQRVRYEETDTEIEDEVDILMSSDILAAQMSTKSINFVRAQSGWIFREDRKELVAGQYDCELYSINGLVLESRKRREHLSRDDLQKNKAIMESLKGGHHAPSLDQNGEIVRRESLTPPEENGITWDEYINSEPGEYPNLGRQIIYKETSKTFRATVAMSKDFPLTVEMLLNVLEVIAPFKHFTKLREFVTLKLPSGFPVKIDIPILPTVSAKITFQKFEFRDNISPDLFEIPNEYTEDSMRFPDL
ncbi:ankyrin repeat domain-containing protein 13C isoform X2 [Sitodiplosis mosellana]|uniref:ankyrin repeat domain-containing protein 13C isoform X2 n=1 Tax=Sitodiplosis mosellana TaxID=263140 RepID=UPI002445156C|nr:ankyrin repeat domain-containing protein 13C isoform X2 [Sitodiplosis mosellana]